MSNGDQIVRDYPITIACAGCGRPLTVPRFWAGTPGRDRARGGLPQRRIVCDPVLRPSEGPSGCFRPDRHVTWAGLDTDRWKLVSDSLG